MRSLRHDSNIEGEPSTRVRWAIIDGIISAHKPRGQEGVTESCS